MRQITITCAGNSAVADSYFAGYQGEHNATQLLWQLPVDLQNYNYILAFSLPDGNTESIIIDKYPIIYSLSQTITQLAGTVTVQLTVLNDGGELIYKTQQVQLHITSSISIDNTAKPYVSELTEAIEKFIAATNQLDNVAITAARNDKGVTISITDKDNSTSVYNVFDGSDYALTDNDKQEIATIVTGDLSNKLDSKQDKLISGTNLKTIDGQSLLGEGNIKTEKEYKRAYVQTTEEVSEIFLETDDFDVCYVNIRAKTTVADKFKISYLYGKSVSRYRHYICLLSQSMQYDGNLNQNINMYKIEKIPNAVTYYRQACFYINTSSQNYMFPYESNDTRNGIVLRADTNPFPVGVELEVYYK